MITVWFPPTDDGSVVRPLQFAEATDVEITAGGFLRLYRKQTNAVDTPIGVVAPGWKYCVTSAGSTEQPADPSVEPDEAEDAEVDPDDAEDMSTDAAPSRPSAPIPVVSDPSAGA